MERTVDLKIAELILNYKTLSTDGLERALWEIYDLGYIDGQKDKQND